MNPTMREAKRDFEQLRYVSEVEDHPTRRWMTVHFHSISSRDLWAKLKRESDSKKYTLYLEEEKPQEIIIRVV